MRYLSVCSGIEAATVAWHGLGWQPAGFSEIEKFPSQVLEHHYPAVPNLGDMTNYKEWDIGTIDLLVGGTPCQSFSVAGLRKGMADPRGNLALVYCGILDHFRPKWFVWENVPGVLSSNGGRDFGSFLGALAQLGYGFAYRVLDAQFFGVAQRRRRVFVVAGPRGVCGPEVLLEPESCGGDTRTRPTPGAHVAALTGNGVGTCGPDDNQAQAGHLIPTRWVGGRPLNVALSLDTRAEDGPRRNQDAPIVMPVVSFNWQGSAEQGADVQTEFTGSLGCTRHPAIAHAYPLAMRGRADGAELEMGDPEIYNSLRAGDGGSSRQNALLTPDLAVRRLTPRECERLMGWPDDHTRWADDGTEIADSHRYRMCGNGVVAPVAEWIGRRLPMEVAA